MADRGDIERARTGGKDRGWRFYLTVGIIVLTFIFVIQNSVETEVKFLFAQTRMPLFFALIIAVLLGAAIGWLTPKVRRSNKLDSHSK